MPIVSVKREAGPKNWSACLWEEISLLLTLENEWSFICPAQCLVTTPNELIWLPFWPMLKKIYKNVLKFLMQTGARLLNLGKYLSILWGLNTSSQKAGQILHLFGFWRKKVPFWNSVFMVTLSRQVVLNFVWRICYWTVHWMALLYPVDLYDI